MMLSAILLLLASAGLLLVQARRQDDRQPAGGEAAPVRPAWGERLAESWWRLGLATSRLGVLVELLLMLASAGLGRLLLSWGGLLLGATAWLCVRILAGQLRRSARKRELLRQLPGFISQVSRRIAVGCTLEQSVQSSIGMTEAPLRTVLSRAQHRVLLGEELSDSFHKEARLNGVPEFGLLASMFSVHHQFGGSVREALGGLVSLLEQRERSQRELRAMTGETRVTAWIMGCMPLLMVAYLLAVNPDYILGLWLEEGGRRLLYFGAAMELAGALALWRMLRSV
ncbi:type II secretion system F family protein [Zobellella denitrificans]|jgi:tight adherence protein B|uniref:type II secretion system F family protein n=1 Tax=Zobellella denitrificans TaxID=347534 RepID=UPI000BBE4E7B|nr:type II secretion system F family protein [Zobellella denitrificans]